jgi:hypothetical protein
MTGRWRCSWENEKGAVEHVDLDHWSERPRRDGK